MDTVKKLLQAVRERIDNAALLAHRQPREITLLAVSKTTLAPRIRDLAVLGQRDFGENYVQEALDKMPHLLDLPLVWHFIGPIQRNKTALIAKNFDWVHSVHRLVIAQRLSAARTEQQGKLNVCIQVNISQEPKKNGVAPSDLAQLVADILPLPNLHLRGLMAIPRATHDTGEQHAQFAALRLCLQTLNDHQLDTLSMGMSADLETAIAEGATIIRVGSALFGARTGTQQAQCNVTEPGYFTN